MGICKTSAVIWTESNVGGGHMQVASQLARALQDEMMNVTVCTSSMDVGHQYDFGNAKIVEMPQIKGKKHTENCVTPKGIFYAPKSTFLQYAEALREVLLRQSDVNTCDATLNIQPWDPLVECMPEGQWRTVVKELIYERQRILRSVLEKEKPQAIVTEFWPLGRPYSDVELEPIMKFLHQQSDRATVFSLERDVLLTSEPRHDRRVQNTNSYIDYVLVRGDENIFSLADTFNEAERIEKPVHYAGYFGNALPQRSSMPDHKREVLVSAGGGYTKQHQALYEAAIRAKKFTTLSERTWRLLVSPSCPIPAYESLQQQAQDAEQGVVVERNKSSPEFKQLLSDCCLSISQGGYNMTIETASNVAPAIVVPYEGNGTATHEQEFRSKRFADMNLLYTINQEDANQARTFAQIIDEVAATKKIPNQLKMNGAQHAAQFILEHIRKT